MRFAVLGAAGQLGRDLCPRLPGEVVPLTRADIDLDQPEAIPAQSPRCRPDVFVNCAAYNFVDKAETEPDAAFAVNAWGVQALARACRAAGAKLVHFSTDYVFGLDANRTAPLTEDDAPGPVSVYGLSKLAGEYLVRGVCAEHARDPHLRAVRRVGQRREGRQLRRDDAAGRGRGQAAARRERPALHAELHRRCRGRDGRARSAPSDRAVPRHERRFLHLVRVRRRDLPPVRIETRSHADHHPPSSARPAQPPGVQRAFQRETRVQWRFPPRVRGRKRSRRISLSDETQPA